MWGIVTNDESMPGGIKLIIEKATDDKTETIEQAAKEGKLAAAEGATFTKEEMQELVAGKEVQSTLDIYLIKNNAKITQFEGKYTVKILLPEALRGVDGLQIVYVNDDGSLEVFQTTGDGKYLEFTTTHFSEFIILGDAAIDLTWLIILLSVVIGIEIVIFAIMAITHKRRGKGERLSAFAPAPLLLAAVIKPTGAVEICIALGITAWLLLVALIASLAVWLHHNHPKDDGDASGEKPEKKEE